MCSVCSAVRKAHEKVKSMKAGYSNLITGHISIQAQERIKICNSCPFNLIGICRLCGCPVQAKANSPVETCDKGYWRN